MMKHFFYPGVLTLLLLLFTIHVHSQQSDDPQRQQVIKGVLAFFKWYENTWDTPISVRNQSGYHLLLNKAGQPEEDDGQGCPCKVDEQETEKYFSWVHKIALPVSEAYQKKVKEQARDLAKQLGQSNPVQKQLELYEAFALNLFHFFPGNGGEPKFSQTDLFGYSGKWTVEFRDAGHAVVRVFFHPGRNSGTKQYLLNMVNENGSWKLSGPVGD